jgi:hypothetical protein
MELTKEQIKQIKGGETLELENNDNLILIWHNSKWENFVLEFNAKVIKSTKTIQPIINKLKTL